VTASSPDPGRPEDPNPLLSLLRRCVVQVHAGHEFGTGFFVAPGEVLTCAHVIYGAGEITVAWDGGSSAASVVVALPAIGIGDHAAAFYPFPDVALLQLTNPPEGHSCVRLDAAEPVAGRQPDLLRLDGFTKGERAPGEVVQSPVGLEYEGPLDEPGGRVFKLKGGQVIGGFSGGPLLNLRTGRVCALVDSTRNERSDLGGFGIPVAGFLDQLPGLADRNQAHHRIDPTWDEAVQAEQRLPSDRDRAEVRLPLGRPIDELTDPFALEVHRAIEIPGATADLPVLPAYVERDHDQKLRALLQQAAQGHSMAVILVGGSSTGKTRACWEAVQALPHDWRLWHPIDPSRPDAAAEALPAVGPRTVIWLNEAQHYLLTPASELGERVAAGLRELMRDPARGPVLLLGTIWPEYWAILTTPAARDQQDDPHAQARALLTGTDLVVSEAFTGPSLQAVQAAAKADPRLEEAATHADDGRITQFLAGGPALLERYRTAPPAAKALIEAAMDARRLGQGLYLPYGLLEAAAPGYLTDQQWDELGEDWLEESLAYCAVPTRGARGPLTRVRPRPGQPPQTGPQYRLADYLEQTGRTTRQALLPPPALWDALVDHAGQDYLVGIGYEAEGRGLLHHALLCYQRAAKAGDRDALWRAAGLLEQVGRLDEAIDLYQRAAEAGNRDALSRTTRLLHQAGRVDEAIDLYQRATEAGDTDAVSRAGEFLEQVGRLDEAIDLYQRAAEAGNHGALWWAAELLERAGRVDEAVDWLQTRAQAGDTSALSRAAWLLEGAGRVDEAVDWLQRAAEAGDRGALESAVFFLEFQRRVDEAIDWLKTRAQAGDTDALWEAERLLERAGRFDEAAQLRRNGLEPRRSDRQ
jgi:tetratricopeptide (TPR) repeat protein